MPRLRAIFAMSIHPGLASCAESWGWGEDPEQILPPTFHAIPMAYSTSSRVALPHSSMTSRLVFKGGRGTVRGRDCRTRRYRSVRIPRHAAFSMSPCCFTCSAAWHATDSFAFHGMRRLVLVRFAFLCSTAVDVLVFANRMLLETL